MNTHHRRLVHGSRDRGDPEFVLEGHFASKASNQFGTDEVGDQARNEEAVAIGHAFPSTHLWTKLSRLTVPPIFDTLGFRRLLWRR